MRSWPKKWNDAALRHIATLPEDSSSRRWPLVGMFAIGLIAGVTGCYAVTRRSSIRRVAMRALGAGDEAPFVGIEAAEPVSIGAQRSNHRRRAAAEVK